MFCKFKNMLNFTSISLHTVLLWLHFFQNLFKNVKCVVLSLSYQSPCFQTIFGPNNLGISGINLRGNVASSRNILVYIFTQGWPRGISRPGVKKKRIKTPWGVPHLVVFINRLTIPTLGTEVWVESIRIQRQQKSVLFLTFPCSMLLYQNRGRILGCNWDKSVNSFFLLAIYSHLY